jgi:FkbM family methyltransferase
MAGDARGQEDSSGRLTTMRFVRPVVKHIAPRATRAWVRAHQLTADRESVRRYVELDDGRAIAGVVELRIKALDGASVFIRPGTSDAEVLRDTFLGEYHLPPEELNGTLRLIWDLGANIGMTMAHLAHLHPDARVVGVELDGANAELARRNIGPWSARCEVIEAAVSPGRGRIEYFRAPGMESGLQIREGGGHFAEVLNLNELAGEPDYVKMDIEGTEARVLREDTDWATRVRAIKVETHAPHYSVSECLDDLGGLGFVVRRDRRHPTCVVGVRVS